jgi:hemerythrin-like domain-containing protein
MEKGRITLNTLLTEHDRIRSCAETLRELLVRADPPDAAELARVRWVLGSAVMRHLAFEERHFYAQLENHSDGAIRVAATTARARLMKEFQDYVDHAARWTPRAIVRNWSRYRLDAHHFLDLLFRRMRLEEEELFPLIPRAGVDLDAAFPSRADWAKDAFVIQARIGA